MTAARRCLNATLSMNCNCGTSTVLCTASIRCTTTGHGLPERHLRNRDGFQASAAQQEGPHAVDELDRERHREHLGLLELVAE